MMHARLPDVVVPEGFTLPFFYDDQFKKENHFDAAAAEMMKEARFGQDPAYRRARLAALREKVQQGQVSESLRAEVLRRLPYESDERRQVEHDLE